ncbi:hypothetical protein SRABI83_00976 [Arthrobacter sp. Bi83]|uniref:hypothetical protein n=1 Tax=Arthrobacter sp. Bi83 TaxID=2822353 RepID=UPI001D9DA0BF|nr:hypothetical protein [Arthrobacter sp. Bi83]CAH0162017.1 hypothetical protein SRABI83_00976 [Arthrobacter sp. Bi83]
MMLDTAHTTRAGALRDLVTELLGLWLLLAVFLDGWAHLNLPSLETFFTPWHAALYSGMLATAAWTAVVIWRNRVPGQPLAKAVPAGYRGTVVGLILFAVAGSLDLLWHELLGIEVSLDALVSPTHLLLGFSLFLILGTGVRSARATSPSGNVAWTPAALFAVVLMTGLGAFFLIYVSVFVRPGPTALFTPTPFGSPGRNQSEMPVVITLASYLLTTALIIAPFLFTLSTAKRPARGVVTMLVAAAAWLPVVMVGLHPFAIAGAVGATVAAVVADLLLARVPEPWLRRRLPAITAGTAALLWTGQLVAFAVTDAIRWPVSLWLGAVVLSAAEAAGLALLSSWSPARSATETAAQGSPAADAL